MLKTAAAEAAATTATIIISVIIIIKGYAHTLTHTHRRTERYKLNETVGKNGLKAKAASNEPKSKSNHTTYPVQLIPYAILNPFTQYTLVLYVHHMKSELIFYSKLYNLFIFYALELTCFIAACFCCCCCCCHQRH